jgi:hypothetical protein
MENSNELFEKMNEYKKGYYEKNSKNLFFKNSQKQNCAQHIASQMDLPTLLSKTCYIIPNTSNIYFDYTLFKLYANESIYDAIVVHTYNTISECISKYKCYSSHLNIKGLTITAIERYKVIIEKYNQYCNHLNVNTNVFTAIERYKVIIEKYNQYCNQLNVNTNVFLEKWCIYNPPSCINMAIPVIRPLLDPLTFSKIVLIDNKESEKQLSLLFSNI